MRLVVVDEDGNQSALPAQEDTPKFIRTNRSRRGMSLQAVADHVGVKRQAVWSWEQGKSLPTVENLIKIVSLFGTAEKKSMKKSLNEVEAILGV